MRRAAVVGAVLVALVAVLYFGVGHESQFVFDAREVQVIVRRALDNTNHTTNAKLLVNEVVTLLDERYGAYMIPRAERLWILNNAGGALGTMLVLHCSLTEYVLVFGTPIGTGGHTGRFLSDDYFTMLIGEQWAGTAEGLEREVYRPGDQHFLPRGHAKMYRCPDTCWAVEYARGNVMSMLPFAVLDAFTSTMDLLPVYQTLKLSAIEFARNLFLRGKI